MLLSCHAWRSRNTARSKAISEVPGKSSRHLGMVLGKQQHGRQLLGQQRVCRKEVINTSPEHVVHLKPALVWNALVLYIAGKKSPCVKVWQCRAMRLNQNRGRSEWEVGGRVYGARKLQLDYFLFCLKYPEINCKPRYERCFFMEAQR